MGIDWTATNAMASSLAAAATVLLAFITYREVHSSLRREDRRDYQDRAVHVYTPALAYLATFRDGTDAFSSGVLAGDWDEKHWRTIKAKHPGLTFTVPSDVRQALGHVESLESKLASQAPASRRESRQVYLDLARQAFPGYPFDHVPSLEFEGWPSQLADRPSPYVLWLRGWTLEQWVDHQRMGGPAEPWRVRLMAGGKGLTEFASDQPLIGEVVRAYEANDTLVKVRNLGRELAKAAQEAEVLIQRELAKGP